MMCEFNEVQALDNAAILRTLSHPLDEYSASHWAEWVNHKCRELGYHCTVAYYRLEEWFMYMAKTTNHGAYQNVLESNPENPQAWLYVAYRMLVEESESRLLVEV